MDRALQLQQEIVQAYRDYQFHLIYQKIHNFCVVDMGGFYLDVIKDRQYTTQTDGLPRRSCQTAMYHIAEAMSRWLAPILSFTADEIWQHLPGERADSVFLETWYQGLFALDPDDPFDRELWDDVLDVRINVSKHLEEARKRGDIGSSLDAELDLYCEPELAAELEKLEDELRFALITSYARVHSADRQAGGCAGYGTGRPVRSSGALRRTPSARAAGTTAKTWARMRSTPSCAGAAWRTSRVQARRGGSLKAVSVKSPKETTNHANFANAENVPA